MLLSIRHATAYSYDKPVFLQPHCLRLTPRSDSYGSLVDRSLNISPKPAGMNVSLENDGSLSDWVRFNAETSLFTIESKVVITLLQDKNPFDFVIYPDTCLKLPMTYPLVTSQELWAYLRNVRVLPSIMGFAAEVLAQAKGQTMDFLVRLCQRMKQEFVYEFREAGAPNLPEDTLASRRGSCRDWAVLYMAAANAVGFATRFVSGYYFDEDPSHPELHAWAEVYVPGGGWRGFDPSLGIACYGHHIPLAASISAAGAALIHGTFKGNAKSEMKVELEFKYSN